MADRNEIRFENKVALVTGGGRGIGRACCLQLAGSGAKVAVNYCANRQAADKTAVDIESAGGVPCIVQADVARREEVDRMIGEIQSALGPIDLLVNNAGVFHHVPHAATTPEIWKRTLDVNLTGVYNVTWAVLDGMIERGYGRIVNVSSISALRARPMSIAYAVSKAGLVALTRSLAEAVAAQNVRVNAVAPGLIDTEIIADVKQQTIDRLIAATPIARLGKPEEIAEVVCFLLSEQSSFMTGQTIVASGGRVTLP